MTNYQILLVVISVFSVFGCSTVKNTGNSNIDDFEVYLLMGQSNMAGRGMLTDSLKNIHDDRVLMLTSDLKWEVARHPIHFDKSIAGVGPGLSFGISMVNAHEGIKVGLVPCAVGGTSIDKWEPGVYDQVTSTYPYNDAAIRITEAMKKGTVKGILWLQGESDSNDADDYLKNLKTLIRRVRKIAGNRKLPVVVGELGQFNSQYKQINNELQKASSKIKYLRVVSSEGFTDIGDRTHFDSSSAIAYGKRFASKMLEVQNQDKKSTICRIMPN